MLSPLIASASVSSFVATSFRHWTVPDYRPTGGNRRRAPFVHNPTFPRVRFRSYSDLEICRIAGDIALIHDISTSSPHPSIRFWPSTRDISLSTSYKKVESAVIITAFGRYSLERSWLDADKGLIRRQSKATRHFLWNTLPVSPVVQSLGQRNTTLSKGLEVIVTSFVWKAEEEEGEGLT